MAVGILRGFVSTPLSNDAVRWYNASIIARASGGDEPQRTSRQPVWRAALA